MAGKCFLLADYFNCQKSSLLFADSSRRSILEGQLVDVENLRDLRYGE